MPIFAFFWTLQDLEWSIFVLNNRSTDIAQKAMDTHYSDPDKGGSGHPSPEERLKNIQATVSQIVDDKYIVDVMQRYELITMVMSHFSGFVHVAMEVALERGVTAHTRWSHKK